MLCLTALCCVQARSRGSYVGWRVAKLRDPVVMSKLLQSQQNVLASARTATETLARCHRLFAAKEQQFNFNKQVQRVLRGFVSRRSERFSRARENTVGNAERARQRVSAHQSSESIARQIAIDK
jgi:hypothetical protein